MKKILTSACITMATICAFAYEVSVGTYVSNAGKSVTVPVALNSAAGLSYAGATITYDPQVLVVTKAEAGTLKTLMPEDFVAVDTNGTLSVTIFGSTAENVAAGSGTIANVTFAVRDGTEGLYSDIAVTDVQLGEKTGVLDATVGNPVQTKSGMIRVMGTGAAVVRLDAPQSICADTSLASLTLKDGDAILADAAQSHPIRIAGAVESEAATIPVKTPIYGWASGKYALLSTTTEGLAFSLEGIDAEYSSETENGITTYYATVAIQGESPIICDIEDLGAEAKTQIHDYTSQAIAKLNLAEGDNALIKQKFDSGAPIKVNGPTDTSISLISDMGLAPAFAIDETGMLNLTYTAPTLEITSFDPTTGAVGIKVTPGQGNSIVASINTGYVHVYGTDTIGETMKYISSVGFDMTKYLKEDSKGEGVINVTLGTHTFLKVKVETVTRTEGQAE